MSTAHRPRRSCLYMPGANARAMEKAREIPADTLILDLEDAVAPEAKGEARGAIEAALKAGGYGPRELVVRMNGLDTEWGHADLEMAAAAGAHAVLAPKVTGARDIEQLDAALGKAGAGADFALWGDDRDAARHSKHQGDRCSEDRLAPDDLRDGHQ